MLTLETIEVSVVDAMLFDFLGVLLAFVTVMALLSLVVTSLVEAFQSVFRLRSRALKKSLMSAFRYVYPADDQQESADKALAVMTSPIVSAFWNPSGSISRITRIFAPQVSWIEEDQLTRILDDSNLDLSGETQATICQRFREMELPMSKHFKLRMRQLSLVSAIGVAFYFQVSAPDLLRELSANGGYRSLESQVVVAAVLEESAETLGGLGNYSGVSGEALERLASQHPDFADVLEEVGDGGDTRSALVADLSSALENIEARDEIVEDYENLLDELYASAIEENLEVVRTATNQLAALNIRPWREGREFYWNASGLDVPRLLGVLITAVLISFGAAFWFEQLATIANLRDALKPKPSSEEATPVAGQLETPTPQGPERRWARDIGRR